VNIFIKYKGQKILKANYLFLNFSKKRERKYLVDSALEAWAEL
jgi:hypothetical protein